MNSNNDDDEEYQKYLNDQRYDKSFASQSDEKLKLGKEWSYQYCKYLTELLPEIDYTAVKMLDIGGRELFTYDFFVEEYENYNLEGIDICASGIEYAKNNNKSIKELDAHKLTSYYKKDSFDLVIAIHSLEHMFDLPKVLKNISEVLKKNGYLYFAIPIPSKNSRKGHWYDIKTQSAMNDLLIKEEFNKVHSEVVKNGKFRKEPFEMIGLYTIGDNS